MDRQAFDSWTKSFATAVNRRGLIRAGLGGGLALLWGSEAEARRQRSKRVTLCYRERTLSVSERTATNLLGRGAVPGQCGTTTCPSGKSCSDGGIPAECCPSDTDVCVEQGTRCCPPDRVCFGGDVGDICCDPGVPCAKYGGCCPSNKSCGVPYRGDPICCSNASDLCVHPEGRLDDREGDCCPIDRLCTDESTQTVVCCNGTCIEGTCVN